MGEMYTSKLGAPYYVTKNLRIQKIVSSLTCEFVNSLSTNNFFCRFDCQSLSFNGDGRLGLLARGNGDIGAGLFTD